MQVKGLNSLGFAAAPKTASAKTSPQKGSAQSFGDVLDQSREAKPFEPRSLEPKNAGPGASETKSTEPKASESKAPVARQEATTPSAQAAGEASVPAQTAMTKTGPETEKGGAPAQADANALPIPTGAPSLNGIPTGEAALPTAMAEPLLVHPASKQKVAAPVETGVDNLTRRVVWNDFLRKMKDDLGVSAEDVLSAFASLSDEELDQPPAATVDKLVAALGLEGSQAQTAKQYFGELISKTQSRTMGEELVGSHRQIDLTLMSQREVQNRQLQRSLGNLNQNFFMKNPEVAAAAPVVQTFSKPPEMIEVAGPTSRSELATQIAKPSARQEALLNDVASAPNQAVRVKPTEASTVDELVRQFLSPQVKSEKLAAATESVGPKPAPNTSVAPAAVSAGSLNEILASLDPDSEGEENGEFTSDASYLAAGLNGDLKTGQTVGPGGDFQTQLAQAAKEPMNVSELVDKAQVMVNEGGGEMKVVMTPEGLGEVAMKVSVVEGKVQVQMVTESDEAKRLIERQLSELKTSLSSNHLQLDTIKIDTATNLGKQMEQQYQDAQRQATQTAWEQFRQDNQGWKRSFFEHPSAKLYKGQNEAPRDIQAPSTVARKNVSRRLDLVA